MDKFEETRVSSEQAYRGYIVNVRKDNIKLSDGRLHHREVVEHPGGVVIIPVTDNNEVILIKQWRYPVGSLLTELPAGKLDYGEEPFIAAKRELEEETGFVANDWDYKGYIYSTPGFCDERLHFYIASGLSKTQTNFDYGENIETYIINISEAKRLVKDGEIKDAKTIVGLSYLE